MIVVLDDSGNLYHPILFENEKDFEGTVLTHR